jgi:hypothetical protein
MFLIVVFGALLYNWSYVKGHRIEGNEIVKCP